MKPVLCFSLLFFHFSIRAQSLTGLVLSSDNNKPVASADIYLANTSTGTNTNEKGEFTIMHFPSGRYDLVVSCIGYEAYHVAVESNKLPTSLQIVLHPKIAELEEVIVESYDKDGWDKWGQIFTDVFIGTSSFANDCKLMNRDVLRLRLLKKRNTVRVTANEPLIIENNALGYILKYNLIQFEYNLDTHSFIYEGFPLFEEMKTTRLSTEKKWKENRLEAYYGSLTHFIRSLYYNKLTEEKFEVREWTEVPVAEKKRIKQMYRYQLQKSLPRKVVLTNEKDREFVVNETDSGKIIHPDSLAYYKSIMQQIDNNEILVNKLLSTKDLVLSVGQTLQHELVYKEKLQTIYLPKKNPVGYQKFVAAGDTYTPVRSNLLRPNILPVYILPQGNYYDGSNIVVDGFWAWWEKICNKLPYDYSPQ